MDMIKKITIILCLQLIIPQFAAAEDGYRLWLRYDQITDLQLLNDYRESINGYLIQGKSPQINSTVSELKKGISGLLGKVITQQNEINLNGILVIGTPSSSEIVNSLGLNYLLSDIGNEGYLIKSTVYNENQIIVISANEDIGLLYGVFHFLRLLQTHQSIENLSIVSSPKIDLRVLNHWDNLDRTVERGYAGFSIWDWHKLPEYNYPQYIDYARANASIGINGTVLTNVNANAFILTPYYLEKVAALANIFRPYGIKVYLTARFSAPMKIGGLETADPLDQNVHEWWNDKVNEIYKYIPDFGGFLVKANSEGQPGPGDYQRSHAIGANMLADALKPHGGIVMWRAFVYINDNKEDRAKQAYTEFTKLEGQFRDNVAIQVKNGPIDFQPREPFHPLFGAMPKTPMMMEFQITQEYLGQGTQLVYLAPMWKEVLESDTYSIGKDSEVSKVIDGSLYDYSFSGIAGVSNIGTNRNWTGHEFGQSNWYAFGRLAWNHDLSSADIAEEWIRMTFSNEEDVIRTIITIMLESHEAVVNYMTPLGLHHIMGWDNHYGPAPWIANKDREDWTSVYYHKADSLGIGFDRTSTGSNATSQYSSEVKEEFSSIVNIPEKYLLWFHHVNWKHRMKSGNTLWDELCYKYYEGVDSVRSMSVMWKELHGMIDDERFESVKTLLKIHEGEAIWWRNACILYFQTFSNMPIPPGLEKPDKTLEYYHSLKFPYAPGIKPKW